METIEKIKFRLNTCEGLVERYTKEFQELPHDLKESARGNTIMDALNQATGQVTALNWVLGWMQE